MKKGNTMSNNDGVFNDSLEIAWASASVADEYFENVSNYEKEGTDNTMIMFGLWTSLLTCLYLRGWTKENFIKELDTYQKIAKEMEETA